MSCSVNSEVEIVLFLYGRGISAWASFFFPWPLQLWLADSLWWWFLSCVIHRSTHQHCWFHSSPSSSFASLTALLLANFSPVLPTTLLPHPSQSWFLGHHFMHPVTQCYDHIIVCSTLLLMVPATPWIRETLAPTLKENIGLSATPITLILFFFSFVFSPQSVGSYVWVQLVTILDGTCRIPSWYYFPGGTSAIHWAGSEFSPGLLSFQGLSADIKMMPKVALAEVVAMKSTLFPHPSGKVPPLCFCSQSV